MAVTPNGKGEAVRLPPQRTGGSLTEDGGEGRWGGRGGRGGEETHQPGLAHSPPPPPEVLDWGDGERTGLQAPLGGQGRRARDRTAGRGGTHHSSSL